MKQLTKDILISLFLGMVLPWMVLQYAVSVWNQRAVQDGKSVQVETRNQIVSIPVRIRDAQGVTREADMDDYLIGVVLAEMPASFETEALKAQAVVARTYARKAWITGGKHKDGSVCSASSCCQAWISEQEYLRQGGTAENVEKIRCAVLSTSGQVLTYDGDLIEATYFSCSGGSTEDAAAVWGTDFPYLQSVDSPGEEGAACYRDTVEFTPEELAEKLGINLTGTPAGWISSVTYTEGGGVDTISIGGKYFTGTEVRSLLGLRSAAFSVETGETAVIVTTRGYGHRVGMSQYGADAMAALGSTYEEILAHYYQGTELMQLKDG